MAADLHIHCLTEQYTQEHYKASCANSLGSKYFNPQRERQPNPFASLEPAEHAPQIWIGEVSWLKAELFDEGSEAFIPDTVGTIADLIGEDFPTLNGELRDRILAAFDLRNTTGYQLAKKAEVETWLNEHLGKQLVTISW